MDPRVADRFCPACGQPLGERMLHGVPRQVCGACGRVHYAHSKPAVGAVLLRDGAALLSLRARAPFAGQWDLPGGFLEAGEHPEEGVAREVREETGLAVRSVALLGVWIGAYAGAPTLNLVYRCEADGEPHAADDSAALRWWPLAALPPGIPWPHERAALALVGGRFAGEPRSPAPDPGR